MNEFPETLQIGGTIRGWLDSAVDWMVTSWDGFFGGVNEAVLAVLVPLDRVLLAAPWWLVAVVAGVIAWRAAGRRTGALATAGVVLIASLGLLDPAIQTMTLVLVAVALTVIIGLPVGILAARSDRFERLSRPVLDGMQTMPSFVYLIPAVMLLGLGRAPAIAATTIYALPPLVRLTSLGIRQVDEGLVEVARSFGATPWQLLLKVQLPVARSTIMAGLNQAVMMALAMAVIASMIGARGLGADVLAGLASLESGRGFVAGAGIVILAVVIDRVTQGLGRSARHRRRGGRPVGSPAGSPVRDGQEVLRR